MLLLLQQPVVPGMKDVKQEYFFMHSTFRYFSHIIRQPRLTARCESNNTNNLAADRVDTIY
jgi:hypothetical protein